MDSIRLCQYKDSLGKPKSGFHEARIGPFALWDTVGTIIIVLILIFVFGLNPIVTTVAISVLTVALHWLFCVETSSNKLIGL